MTEILPPTVSALEIVRALVACYGLSVSLRGRSLAHAQQAAIATDPHEDPHVRRERELRDERMALYATIQSGFCVVHGMLLVNSVVNMGYMSASIEQLNVLTSNVTQVLIPLILARASELISAQMRTALRLHNVTGPRDTTEDRP